MKKIILACLVFVFAFTAPKALAAKDQKGASAQAYEHANENAVFNRVGDWFATIGKSEGEKEAILSDRKVKRAAKRAEKEARKAQKKEKGELEDEGKKAKDVGSKMNKKMKKGFSKKGSSKKGS